MSKFIDLTGKTFGEWNVLSLAKKGTNIQTKWHCMCSCGREYDIAQSSLVNGKSTKCRTCGNTGRNPYPQELRYILKGMIQRCHNQNSTSYGKYGAKGISVCSEWKNNRMSFYKWSVENGYAKGLTIDRIDSSKGYSPENCRWITLSENNKNRNCVSFATIKGETKTISDWANILNMNLATVLYRIKKMNMSPEEALLTPINLKYKHR